MEKNLFESFKINPFLRANIGNGKIYYYNVETIKVNELELLDVIGYLYIPKIRRPNDENFDKLKDIKSKLIDNFNVYDYKYSLGFFSGCHKFNFRITFKEYKVGLKPAKFSLLLNQFRLDLDLFITLIQEILVNNFAIEFYEDLFKDYFNDLDFKIHFLVVLRRKHLTQTGTKFFIIPTGCFLIYLRKQLWYTIFLDFVFLYSCHRLYKGFKKYIGVFFLLVLFYIYKLIHQKISKVINKYKIYDLEDRMYGSLGNILVLKYISFKLYCKRDLRLLRHSYLFSRRCLSVFIDDDEFDNQNQFIELEKIKSYDFIFSNSIDLIDLNLDLEV